SEAGVPGYKTSSPSAPPGMRSTVGAPSGVLAETTRSITTRFLRQPSPKRRRCADVFKAGSHLEGGYERRLALVTFRAEKAGVLPRSEAREQRLVFAGSNASQVRLLLRVVARDDPGEANRLRPAAEERALDEQIPEQVCVPLHPVRFGPPTFPK